MAQTVYWLDVDGNWTNTANWSTGVVPGNGDTVYILGGIQNIATNLNQSAVTVASLIIGMGFTGMIGTSSTYLQIGATNWTIGVPQSGGASATGSGRIKIDFGTAQFAGTILGTSNNSADAGLEPVRIKGSNASNTLVMQAQGGKAGVGTTSPTETATISEANISAGTLNYGFGVTWTTANVSAQGTFTSQSGAGTTLTTSPGATATVNGTGVITTANMGGATYLNNRSAGSVATTVNLYPTGTADFSQNSATGTIGTLNHYKGGTWNTNPAKPNHITATTYTRVNGGSLVLN